VGKTKTTQQKIKTRKLKKKIVLGINPDTMAINAHEAVRILGGDLGPPDWQRVVSDPQSVRKR
jgi:hypothetical protein